MKVWPATVMVLVRDPPLLAATLKVTRPSPVPEAPPVIVIHAALDAAVHVQLLPPVVTSIVPAPPAAAMVWPPG